MRVLVALVIAVLAARSSAEAGVRVSPSHELTASPAPTWTANPGVVLRAEVGPPSGAGPCETTALVVEGMLHEFVAAFNSGSESALRAVLSQEFWAISMGYTHAYTRDDAVRMLVERSTAGERLALRSVRVNGLVGWDGAAHLGPVDFVLTRGHEAWTLSGKGALFCAGTVRAIKVLGLGML